MPAPCDFLSACLTVLKGLYLQTDFKNRQKWIDLVIKKGRGRFKFFRGSLNFIYKKINFPLILYKKIEIPYGKCETYADSSCGVVSWYHYPLTKDEWLAASV